MPGQQRSDSLARRLRKVIAAAANVAALPIALSWRRSGRHWVFGHEGEAFAGNPKYLFLWIAMHRPDLHATWLTGSRATRDRLVRSGYMAALRWSPAGVMAALRAKTYIFAHDVKDVNAPLSWGANRLNVWHGVGLKAMQVARGAGLRGWFRNLALIPYDRIATTSDLMQAHFAAQFGLPPERCPQLGYSRLDCSGDERLRAAARETDVDPESTIDADGFSEIYIYLPTYRDSKRAFLARAIPDIGRLSESLSSRNALLYVKLHPRTRESLPAAVNVLPWPDGADIYAYMASFTGLITDYSSVLYDYLYDRSSGIILYTFDYEDYVGSDRVLLHGYDENVTGVRVADFDGLCAALRDGTALDPARMPDAEAIRRRFWGGSSFPASAAIVDYVADLRHRR